MIVLSHSLFTRLLQKLAALFEVLQPADDFFVDLFVCLLCHGRSPGVPGGVSKLGFC